MIIAFSPEQERKTNRGKSFPFVFVIPLLSLSYQLKWILLLLPFLLWNDIGSLSAFPGFPSELQTDRRNNCWRSEETELRKVFLMNFKLAFLLDFDSISWYFIFLWKTIFPKLREKQLLFSSCFHFCHRWAPTASLETFSQKLLCWNINYATTLLIYNVYFLRKPFSDLSLTIFSNSIVNLRYTIDLETLRFAHPLVLHKKIHNQQHLALIDNKLKWNTFSLVSFTTTLSFFFRL